MFWFSAIDNFPIKLPVTAQFFKEFNSRSSQQKILIYCNTLFIINILHNIIIHNTSVYLSTLLFLYCIFSLLYVSFTIIIHIILLIFLFSIIYDFFLLFCFFFFSFLLFFFQISSNSFSGAITYYNNVCTYYTAYLNRIKHQL